jgi:hypothetical protein
MEKSLLFNTLLEVSESLVCGGPASRGTYGQPNPENMHALNICIRSDSILFMIVAVEQLLGGCMSNYQCLFRDQAGSPCGQVTVEADTFDQIAQWASELLTKSDARPKGVEIWHNEERLASFGTAFRPQRSMRASPRSRPVRKRRGLRALLPRGRHDERRAANGMTWLQKLLRSLWP